MSMRDAYAVRRRQWLRQLSRSYSRNQNGVDIEELTWWVSERLALVICGALVVAVVMEVLK